MQDLKISLAAARVNANKTQQEVAKYLKVSGQTIVNWEKGKSMPSIAQARDLAKFYKIDMDNIDFLLH